MRNAASLAAACLGLALLSSLSISCSSSTDDTSSSSGTVKVPTVVTFSNNIVPMVQESCALAACHSSKESNLGIYLTFEASQIYEELQKKSPTSNEKHIVPGDPVQSYVLAKIEGRQGTAKCTGSCGTEMPPPPDPKLTATQIAVWRKWITEGAKNN